MNLRRHGLPRLLCPTVPRVIHGPEAFTLAVTFIPFSLTLVRVGRAISTDVSVTFALIALRVIPALAFTLVTLGAKLGRVSPFTAVVTLAAECTLAMSPW